MTLRIYKDHIEITHKDYDVIAMYSQQVPADVWHQLIAWLLDASPESSARLVEVAGASDNATIIIRGAGS